MTAQEILLTTGMASLAGAVTFWATPLAGRLAALLKMHDRPAERKLHAAQVPYLGGIAILAGWVVVFLTPGTLGQSVVLVGIMGTLALLGFVDDRVDMSPYVRLGLQIAAAVAAYAGGIRMTPFDSSLPDLVLTVVWLVGITNAFNFMDNMDGLAAGVGAIAAVSFGITGIIFGQKLVSLLAFALAGSCVGFLRHNFHPARIFMGDTGSLPIGFGLAALGIKVSFAGVHPLIAFSVPVTILGLFIVDTSVMAIGRHMRREAIVGGRLDHLSHRLLQRALPVPCVARRLYLAASVLGATGVVVSRTPFPVAAGLLGAVAIAGILFVATALRWPVMIRSEDELDPASEPALKAAFV